MCTQLELKAMEERALKAEHLLELEKRWTKNTQGVLTTFAKALSTRNKQLRKAEAALKAIDEMAEADAHPF